MNVSPLSSKTLLTKGMAESKRHTSATEIKRQLRQEEISTNFNNGLQRCWLTSRHTEAITQARPMRGKHGNLHSGNPQRIWIWRRWAEAREASVKLNTASTEGRHAKVIYTSPTPSPLAAGSAHNKNAGSLGQTFRISRQPQPSTKPSSGPFWVQGQFTGPCSLPDTERHLRWQGADGGRGREKGGLPSS